ncbi:phosphonate ABC transporter ATP-binding protein [Nocardia sp. CS682]|uniref:phosphonate ABC transporter ATP-binding protein n=1 Tax=Nocardia sp. CS682 TaxID=1047172 RepID=UPI001074C0C3|nr:ATP-binding cassette domain-containing protein [Nocardia sp. CS682]QBS44871.1 ABC transporter ATP-binding protein [Nocardia sp. CS682]
MANRVFELQDVTVRYGATVALAGIDLTVAPGERIAVIGPSGAGKTTLIGLLNGTSVATEGRVRALGCEYTTADVRAVRVTQRRIGTIYQQFDLVDQLRTVHNVNAGRLGSWPFWKGVLSLVRPQELRSVRAALDRVGIGDKINERTGSLSGGEKQRVAIARVLVQKPVAILADEPVASLDQARGRQIIDLLLALSIEAGVTLITSLHDVDLALSRFDRIVGLRAGRLIFDCSRKDLSDTEIEALYVLEPTVVRR